MRTYRGPEGDERLWFEDDEIELIAEDELRRATLYPTVKSPIVNIESFIEQHLKASLDQYADLDAEVLGLTEFQTGRPPAVRINRDLTGSAVDSDQSAPGILGRWRATLAHEAAHIALHRILFEVIPNQGSLFETGSSNPLVFRCLKRGVTYRAGGKDWREVQANKGMAALLMPRGLFIKEARRELHVGAKDEIDGAARRLAERFSVSREAATIRLSTFGFRAVDRGSELFAV